VNLSRLGLGKLERHELAWLFVGLGACVLLLLFLILAGQVGAGDTQAFDTALLRALRRPGDLSKPIGPAWLTESMIDISAMGGSTVLALVVFAVAGFLLLQTRLRTALFVAATAVSGDIVSNALKLEFHRPRPAIVPHLRQVFSTSFPSGHAMESAIVYLTLGTVLMRVAETRVTKAYCLSVAAILTVLVGISRVYLGVHYPTDVIGGWIIGFVWASICWLIEARFEDRTGIDRERAKRA
jgi:undecaprenyl-diphosphatase